MCKCVNYVLIVSRLQQEFFSRIKLMNVEEGYDTNALLRVLHLKKLLAFVISNVTQYSNQQTIE